MAKPKNATNMTANWVKQVASPPEGRKDYFDRQVTGLGLRVSSTGHKSWFAFYRNKADKKACRLVLGAYPAMTLADARMEGATQLLAAQQGANPASKRREEIASPTFKELAMDYIERDAKARELRSWRVKERQLAKYVYPVLGALKAHEIQRREVTDLLEGIRDNNGPIISNRVLSLVRRVFYWALKRDMVKTNPAARIDPLGKEVQCQRTLTKEEVRLVWKAFEKEDAAISTMFKLRLLTAQRGGEVEKMRWVDLDFEDLWWTIPPKIAKNHLAHRVPLSPAVCDLILAMRARTGNGKYVFPSPRSPDRAIANVQKAAHRVRETSGINDFTLHDLRRTAASLMTGMKVPRLVVSKILNHVEFGITRVYDRHAYDDEKREALEAWAKHLEAFLAAEGRPAPLAPPAVSAKPTRRRRVPVATAG